MPGRTWRDLKGDSAPSSDNKAPGAANSIDSIAEASQSSPRLSRLLEQRQMLEHQLNTLTHGGEEQLSPRDAAKFQVPTFAERQAQLRTWEKRRDTLRAKASEVRATSRRNRETGSTNRSVSSGNGGANTLLSGPGGVNQWLSNRDTQRQSLRETARDRLSPLNRVANIGRQLHGSLSNASSQLRDLDRQLAEQGLNQERDELNRLGTGKLDSATSRVDRYSKMAEAPMRAVDKIDRFWENRSNDISGAMDRVGPYFDRSQRRLSTESGGSGNLFERMERNRLVALQKRREERRQQKRDEDRNERARRNRNQGD